jgi:hypothetical protein
VAEGAGARPFPRSPSVVTPGGEARSSSQISLARHAELARAGGAIHEDSSGGAPTPPSAQAPTPSSAVPADAGTRPAAFAINSALAKSEPFLRTLDPQHAVLSQGRTMLQGFIQGALPAIERVVQTFSAYSHFMGSPQLACYSAFTCVADYERELAELTLVLSTAPGITRDRVVSKPFVLECRGAKLLLLERIRARMADLKAMLTAAYAGLSAPVHVHHHGP